jgi:hypothetical protein
MHNLAIRLKFYKIQDPAQPQSKCLLLLHFRTLNIHPFLEWKEWRQGDQIEPIGRLFSLGSFMSNREVALTLKILIAMVKNIYINFDKNGLGHV